MRTSWNGNSIRHCPRRNAAAGPLWSCELGGQGRQIRTCQRPRKFPRCVLAHDSGDEWRGLEPLRFCSVSPSSCRADELCRCVIVPVYTSPSPFPCGLVVSDGEIGGRTRAYTHTHSLRKQLPRRRHGVVRHTHVGAGGAPAARIVAVQAQALALGTRAFGLIVMMARALA